MKTTLLILSVLTLTSCKTLDENPYPDEPILVLDLANVQCRYRRLVDHKKVKFSTVYEYHTLYLVDGNGNYIIGENGRPKPNPKCEGMWGYLPESMKKVQNWARDIQGN